jgi:hypothetical protein
MRILRSSLVLLWAAVVACAPATTSEERAIVPPGFGLEAIALEVTEDAAVWAGLERSTPHGDGVTIQVKTYEDTDEWGWAFRRALLRFDLRGLEDGDVGAVHLALFGNLKDGVEPVTTQLFGILDEDDTWGEDDVTWESQPPRAADTPLGELAFEHVLERPERYEVEGRWHFSTDLSASLREELAQDGLLSLRIENATVNEVLFFTREHQDAFELSPRLVVIPPLD